VNSQLSKHKGKTYFLIGKYAINKKQSFVLKIKNKKIIKNNKKIIYTFFPDVYTTLVQSQN